MSLIGFKYLNQKRILTLILILTLTSTLFLVTAFSFLSFYNGFTNFMGEEKDIVAIYGNAGRTPFSGAIPAYLADKISPLNGVLASSPEAIAPSVIKDKSLFIRGIIPQEFFKLNNIAITEGEPLKLTDANSAMVGKRLSQRLNLQVNDKILAFGVLKERYVELQIKGIYESNSAMDDEALVPLYVGQWLRGLDYNSVSLIRAKIDPNKTTADNLYQTIAKEAQQPTTPQEQKDPTEQIIPFAPASFKIGDVGVERAQNFMKSYLDRYGVTKDTLIVLSIMVLVFASGTSACALTLFIDQHRREIGIIRTLGASERKIKTDLITKVLTWSSISSILGVFIATALLTLLQQVGYLQVLSHTVNLQIDPLTIAANFIIISLLVTAIISRSGMKQ
jgi:ABC-type lipoprotein release transport system permease subunit